ncbi:AbrB/MazE/SpoVT family DNA-binding domain-containing protein [Pseudorhodoplanes sp.]|uniref:AbrB/MazE/SpoVT family DNA-binding domain-containing protein n=1 Tax=Pseudorhodoplanes sp. TaxID=1934341 RepID=UPI003D0E84B1
MNKHVAGAKIAEQLLTRAEGATMAEVIAATGGPQYNLLKRLAALGYSIRKTKEGSSTRYFAKPPVAQTFEATITGKGQLTLPKAIRDRLQLRDGQKLRLSVDEGHVVMEPVFRRLSDLHGILPKPRRAVSLEEMDEGIRDAVAARFKRAVSGKR